MWWMWAHASEIARDGYILLHAYPDVPGPNYLTYNEIGLLTGVTMPNGHLAYANLMDRYWTWGRPFDKGRMNGLVITFDSFEYRKIQENMNFPSCCTAVDFNGFIRTEFGDGLLYEAMYESKSGMMKLSIAYE